jgi:hypothetical protein
MMDEIKKYEAIVEEMIYMMTIKMWIIVRKIDEIEKEEIKIQNLNKQKEVKDDEGRVI